MSIYDMDGTSNESVQHKSFRRKPKLHIQLESSYLEFGSSNYDFGKLNVWV